MNADSGEEEKSVLISHQKLREVGGISPFSLFPTTPL